MNEEEQKIRRSMGFGTGVIISEQNGLEKVIGSGPENQRKHNGKERLSSSQETSTCKHREKGRRKQDWGYFHTRAEHLLCEQNGHLRGKQVLSSEGPH